MSGTSKVHGGADATARVRRIGPTVAARVLAAIHRFSIDVTAAAKLLVPFKTGRLSASIHPEVQTQGKRIIGYVGTNVEYARQFEKGFSGTENVREFVRRQTMAWGHPINPELVTVRPFTRTVNRPARPFLQPALDNMRPTLADRLKVIAKDMQ